MRPADLNVTIYTVDGEYVEQVSEQEFKELTLPTDPSVYRQIFIRIGDTLFNPQHVVAISLE